MRDGLNDEAKRQIFGKAAQKEIQARSGFWDIGQSRQSQFAKIQICHSTMSDRLEPYIALISSFVSDEIEAIDFERKFLKLFKEDATEWSGAEFAILDGLFVDVDAFCPDPQLRDEEDVDEYELKEKGKIALEKLQSLVCASS